jgi:hypothetical protein
MADLERAYRTLGLEPGVSFREVMEAHSDLVTVWDPKRFTGSPRLEHRALRELQAVNQAFELIRSQLPSVPGAGRSSSAGSSSRSAALGVDPTPKTRGPVSSSASLYESAFDPGARRRARVIWLAVAVLAAVIILFLAFSGSESGPGSETVPDSEAQLSGETRSVPLEQPPVGLDPGTAVGRAIPAEPQPADMPTASPASPASKQSAQSGREAELTIPVKRAFELLQDRSTVARSLVENGSFQDFRLKKWGVASTRLPEISIDMVAQKVGDESDVHLVWAVNLETETIRPTSQALIELLNRDSGPKPALVRQF